MKNISKMYKQGYCNQNPAFKPAQGSLRVTLLRLCSVALALTVTVTALAQAPQGFNYQAVVLNSLGGALSNQTVSLQLSILDSSASGVTVYTETQNPTTDTTGLFSVVIGNGTVVTGNFSTINWGKNSKFLKTEIDTAGGTNYVLMGISQMMSVPYALYTNPTYASMDYPDGIKNITPVLIDSNAYTVPFGKNLYIPPGMWYGIIVNSDTLTSFNVTSVPQHAIGVSSNQIVSIYPGTFQGWLVDKSVDWITINISANPFTVPVGKIFIITGSAPTNSVNGSFLMTLDGVSIGGTGFLKINGTILSAGQVLSASLIWGSGSYVINGYFRDE